VRHNMFSEILEQFRIEDDLAKSQELTAKSYLCRDSHPFKSGRRIDFPDHAFLGEFTQQCIDIFRPQRHACLLKLLVDLNCRKRNRVPGRSSRVPQNIHTCSPQGWEMLGPDHRGRNLMQTHRLSILVLFHSESMPQSRAIRKKLRPAIHRRHRPFLDCSNHHQDLRSMENPGFPGHCWPPAC
jgi:hypothetical protein